MDCKHDTKFLPQVLIIAFALSVFSFWCAFAFSRSMFIYHNLAKRGVVTEGTAIKPGKNSRVSYVFEVNGQMIRATTPVAWSWAKDARFPQSIRIRYLPDRPEISEAFELRNHRLENLNYGLIPLFVVLGFVFALNGFTLVRAALRKRQNIQTNIV
jgi:hypothetical protein